MSQRGLQISPPADASPPGHARWNGGPSVGSRLRLLVVLLALAAYVGTVQYQFVWDDLLMLAHSGRLRTLGNLPAFLHSDFTTLTGGAIEGHYFRPTLAASLAWDATLWGLRPAAFHLTNILLHAAVTLLVMALVRSLSCSGGVAALAGILFALHPVHAEAVAWVSARQELLLGLAALGCVLAYRRWTPQGWGNVWGIAALALYGLALLSKEPAIILPLLLLASDLYGPPSTLPQASSVGWRPAILRSLPFWGLSLTFGMLRLPALRILGGTSLSLEGLWQRVPGALETLGRYVVLSLIPIHMQPVYALNRPTSAVSLWPAFGVLLCLLLPSLVVWWWRRHRPAAFGVLWFMVCIVPVVDLVPVSAREMGLTDRYLYLPSLGICLALSWWIARGMQNVVSGARTFKSLAWITISLLVFGYSWSLLRYLPVWQDEVALYGRMVATAPYSPVAQFNLGLALLEAGHTTRARPRLEQAATLNPTLSRPRVLLALLDVSEGRLAEGLRRLDAIASSGPLERDYFVAHATAHLMAGHWHEAAVLARAGLQRFPKDAALTFRLAEALEGDSQLVEATSWYRRALLLYPDLVEAEVALGLLGLRLGQTQEANAHFRLALASQPDYAQAHRGLALVAEAAGDREESIRRWRHVLELATAGAPVREAMDHLRRLSQSDRGATLDHAPDGPPPSDAGSRR